MNAGQCSETAKAIADAFEAWAAEQRCGDCFQGGPLHNAGKHSVGMWASRFVRDRFLAPRVWCSVHLRGGDVRCIGPYQTRSDALAEVPQGYYPLGVQERCSDCISRRHACTNAEKDAPDGA